MGGALSWEKLFFFFFWFPWHPDPPFVTGRAVKRRAWMSFTVLWAKVFFFSLTTQWHGRSFFFLWGLLAQVRLPEQLAVTHTTITVMKELSLKFCSLPFSGGFRHHYSFPPIEEEKKRNANTPLAKSAWWLYVLLNIADWQGDWWWVTGCSASAALAAIASISSCDSFSPLLHHRWVTPKHLTHVKKKQNTESHIEAAQQAHVTWTCVTLAFRSKWSDLSHTGLKT